VIVHRKVLQDYEAYAMTAWLSIHEKKTIHAKAPSEIRNLGGGLFCDRRYDHVFVYHNGAESYYAARGFRGRIKV
jgi:hypothetical protein